MTLTATPPPAGAGTTAPGTSTSPTAATLWRRGRGVLAAALLVLVVAALTVLATGTNAPGAPLDPRDATPDGGRALAEILGDRGVRVERVSGIEEIMRLDGPDTQILLTDTSHLSTSDVTRLVQGRSDLLIAGPVAALSRLAPEARPKAQAVARSREPGCALPAAVRAGSVYLGGIAFTTPRGAVGCYPSDDGPTLVRTTGARTVTVTGDNGFMSNRRLAEDGNAALAINLAGAKPVLAWVVEPDREQGGTGTPGSGRATLGELIPAQVPWAVVQLGVALLLAALWRGRRLGPVVAERLPVAVRAAETVEGRGRLYRARRARDRAAATLRAATAARIAPRLGLAGDAGPDSIIAATALRTGQDPRWVHSVMYGPTPADDAGLVALAGHLDTLERQVREP
ncbi:hypothetical protein Sru01_03630 [Sphaerisporangium rufum]|uniref:DUF4350 domain-containing protein n=1 Tax=Sphaerisporangium rufum TaxID=1381558 RepID=A0A919QWH2_9ACTN|nr:DUF4350 domain-containing protein [Sphaerisporangium rufum]GII75381.1 hypothetical protein Sru01_03630 [Sphaerisporangium rufum]